MSLHDTVWRVTRISYLSTGLLLNLWNGPLYAQLSPNSWGIGPPMPTARSGAFAGAIAGTIYVIGGMSGNSYLNVNEIYDTSANTWSTGAPLPTPRWAGATAVVGNTLYAIGGGNSTGGLTVVEAYNAATNSWATKSPMPVIVDSVFAVVANNIVYVVGGFNTTSKRLHILQAYNPATDSWTMLASMNVGKSSSALGVFGSTIVSAGGLLVNSTSTTDNEGYNIAANSWTTLAPLPSPRQATCFGAFGDVLYLAGGHTVGNGSPLDTMDAYDAATNSWQSGLPTAPYAVVNTAPVAVNGQLYCFGGSNEGDPGEGSSYDYVQIYQPPSVSSGQPTNVLPQLAFGGGWYTALYFTNLNAGPVSFVVDFVAQDGTPLAIPALNGPSATVSVGARGSAVIQIPNVGSLTQGYVTASLPAGVTGYGVFRYTAPGAAAGQEAVVPLSGVTATTSTLIFDETSYTTGVAIVGLGSSAGTVNVTAYGTGGNTIGTGTIELPPNGQTAVLLRDIPGLAAVVGQIGSVDFSVTSGNVAALGIRYNGQAFTSIPTSDR